MKTRHPRRSPATLAALLLMAAACSAPGAVAGHSPSPASSSRSSSTAPASPSPAVVTAAYGVLVGQPTAPTYTVSLVATDGKVVTSAQASTPAAVTCANAAASVVPLPVSTSNSRLYFMDGQGVVRFLSPNGDTGRATAVPIGAARRSMFAVSPDDERIAVVVADFNSTGAATRLYVEDLNGGGNHVDLFSESGAYTLWPVGWHGTNNLVLAKVPSCTQGGGPGCCGPQELHVVDPATAARRFTIGGSTCIIAGAPSLAGAICENAVNYTRASLLNWTGLVVAGIGIQGPAPAYLSPNGSRVALVAGIDTTVLAGQTFVDSSRKFDGMQACGWIDDTHLLSGGDTQQQPRVGNVTDGSVVPVAAQGDCGGRIPGGL